MMVKILATPSRVDETGVYCGGFVTGSVGELGGGSEDAVVIKLSPMMDLLRIKQIGRRIWTRRIGGELR